MQKGNLPVLDISIEPSYLRVLQRNIWSERLVPATLSADGVSHEAGLAYRGAHTRGMAKKSYRVDFGAYNRAFGGREIHLNAEYLDPSVMRNKMSFDFFKDIGSISPDCQHVLLQVNGKPMGIYLQIESVDAFFLHKRGLSDGPIFYATSYYANFSLMASRYKPKSNLLAGYTRKQGEDEDSRDLEDLIAHINTISREDFGKEIVKYVDVEKYLLWLCGVVCTQNYDGFIQNYALYRNGKTGLYEMIPWDYDATWGRDWNARVMEYDYVPITGYNTLTARLLDVKDIRSRYQHLLKKILATSFTVEALEPKVTAFHQQLRPYLAEDPYKRKSIAVFDREPDYILAFITNRNQYLQQHLKDLS
ncbi:CotH kinase family protein [Ectobacillus ponti]|uniref:CotH kinase family protein n=1 Tax=Ectobacillus ponti TaxID=2961894 RepID=A0AA42BNR3_9BACI|nr:CotH kinase family protein [Ectobacillus ponti]